MIEVASLRYGVIFKKAFSDVEIFTGFARDILGIQLEIDHVETEKSFSTSIGNVTPRFDLYAEDKKNRVIVEIQHERYGDHYDRFLHYHCLSLLEQVKNSLNYRPPLKVFTIVVLTSGDKHKKDVSVIDFDPTDLQGNKLGEIQHKIIFLCPKYWNNQTPEHYKEWLEAINDSLDEKVDESHYHLAEIQKIFSFIEKNLISPDDKAKMIEEYNIEESKHEEFEKGIDEGFNRGELKGKLATAKELLAMGLSLDNIKQATGLTDQQLTQLD